MKYQAGPEAGEYFYPLAGDAKPEPYAKVQLLTKGGVHTTGPWMDNGFYIGWLPLPKRNKHKEQEIQSMWNLG